jgi:hypothetical protein
MWVWRNTKSDAFAGKTKNLGTVTDDVADGVAGGINDVGSQLDDENEVETTVAAPTIYINKSGTLINFAYHQNIRKQLHLFSWQQILS